jgi:hypothetical protein
MSDTAEEGGADARWVGISALTERVFRVRKSDTAFHKSTLRLVELKHSQTPQLGRGVPIREGSRKMSDNISSDALAFAFFGEKYADEKTSSPSYGHKAP